MTRSTGNGAGKSGPRPVASGGLAAPGGVSVALAALQALRDDLRQALARVEAAIAEIERPPVGAARPDAVPGSPEGVTARPKRVAPLREKGERGRRAPVLPGRRTPPREGRPSPERPGEDT